MDAELISPKTTKIRHKCSACFQMFNKPEHLVAHMKTSYHSVHQPKCGICMKHSKTLESVREHLNVKGICNTEFFERGCILCLKVFEGTTSTTLAAHKNKCQLSAPHPLLWTSNNAFMFEGKRYDSHSIVTITQEDAKFWLAEPQCLRTTTLIPQATTNVWTRPNPTFLKCNIGSSWIINRRNCGVSWLLRDDRASVIIHGRRAYPSTASSVESDLLAILWAVESLSSLSFKNVIFETSSRQALEVIGEPERFPLFHHTLTAIQQFCSTMGSSKFEHVRRAGNRVASQIAYSVTHKDPRYQQSYIASGGPKWLHPLIKAEAASKGKASQGNEVDASRPHGVNTRLKAVALAIDCKMVGAGLCPSICMVDEDENVILSTHVQPYRYEVTGLTQEDLENGMPHEDVREEVFEILCGEHNDGAGRLLLVGHDLRHAMNYLNLHYPSHFLRDTAKYRPLMKTRLVSQSLRYLTRSYLGYNLQSQPYDYCVSSMRLYKRMRDQEHELKPEDRISRSDYRCWCLD